MKKPLISVIIPIYNVEKYIVRCIYSIQNNDYSNLEIICVNDGSTDNGLSVLEKLAKDDPRIIIIDKPNGGVSSARNAGLDASTGEYIAFIDADDWIHPSYFSVLVNEAEKNGSDIIIGKYKEVYENDSNCDTDLSISQASVHTLSAIQAMLNDGYIRRSVWGRIYKKEVIHNKYFPVGIHFGEDIIFNSIVSDFAECMITTIDLPLYYYYQSRNDSLLHIKSCEANYIIGSWFIDNISSINNKSVAVFSAFSTLLSYRFEGSFSPDAKHIRKKSEIKLDKCLNVLFREIDCSLTTKVKYFVLSKSNFLYRIMLRITDPSTIYYEKLLKEKYLSNN